MSQKFRSYKFRFLVPLVTRIVSIFLGSRTDRTNKGENFFFIMGSGRNGSTLLSAILNRNPAIFIPPEQYILPFASISWHIRRDLSGRSFTKGLITRFLNPDKTVNWELDQDDLANALGEGHSGFTQLMESIWRTYAKKKGKGQVRLLGEKSPLTTHHLPNILKDFRNSRFIFLIRDPRAVVYSYSKVEGHAAKEVAYALWKWKDSLEMIQYLETKGVTPHVVRYEDLVIDPEKEVGGILTFLGLDPMSDILNFNAEIDALGVGSLSHHQNLRKPINTDSINQWQGKLSPEVLDQIKTVAELAKPYGYAL